MCRGAALVVGSSSSMSDATSKRAREEEWHDYCAECKRSGGALLCCDGCPRSYHLTCAHLRSMPVGEWLCTHCSSEVGAKESVSTPPNVLVPSSPNVLVPSEGTPAASTPAAVPTSADSASEASAKVPSSTVSAGALPASSAIVSPPPSPTSDKRHALLQTSQALRTLAASELAHAQSEITKADSRLSEARGTVARLEAERAALVQRSEHLGTILNNLAAISSTVDAPPPQAPPPPLVEQPGAGGANSPAPASSAALPAAPTKALSPPNKNGGGFSFGRELSRPGRVRTVALWNPACLRHTPQASCPEQPARLRAVVAVLEELSAAHPSLLSLSSSSTEVESRHVSAVHAPEYVSMLERSQPRGWEPPMRLGAARATNGTSAANHQQTTTVSLRRGGTSNQCRISPGASTGCAGCQ